MSDLLERIERCATVAAMHEEAAKREKGLRDTLIRAALDQGESFGVVARAAHLSKGRVGAIAGET